MFLDYTLSTTNNKKHKMVIPFIEQFKQIKIINKNIELDNIIKRNILSKICRRCVFSQLESIIDIFDLRAIDNRQIVIDFINEQIEQHQDMIFISHITKILKLLEINAIPFEKVFILQTKSQLIFYFLYSQIIVPLVLKSQWETVRFVVGDEKILQEKLLKIIDDLISTDKLVDKILKLKF